MTFIHFRNDFSVDISLSSKALGTTIDPDFIYSITFFTRPNGKRYKCCYNSNTLIKKDGYVTAILNNAGLECGLLKYEVEFELYLIKEFQRLKEEEQKALGWSAKRELAKINYHIHTDAIKEHLIPQEIDAYHRSLIYANEADVLNVALFGMTAKEWRDAHPDDKGNIRDYATINQLICLSNMENLNAVFINEGMPQPERLHKLNQIAIQQMTVLENVESKHILKA